MLEFETPSGNIYAWDNELGLFIPFSQTMRAVIKETINQKSISKQEVIRKLKDNFAEKEIIFCYDWLKKWEKVKHSNQSPQIPQKLNIFDIKRCIFEHCLVHLILNVTEDCNFRCNYCVYSGKYKYYRSHSNKYMDFSIAKKALDNYFSLLKEGNRYNPMRKPAIGFYGGEPLLNFKLIKECVDYIDNEYGNYEVKYNITTNGSLLDEKKANWLMKYNFSISVSLDGPEEEHNRNRVYGNGRGTFRDVIKNIDRITHKGYDKIDCISVYDWKTNIFKLDDFFKRDYAPRISDSSSVNGGVDCSYFERFSANDRLEFLEQLQRARDYYFEGLNYQKQKESFLDTLIGAEVRKTLFRSYSIHTSHLIPFTGACVPGRKIFVDVNGNYHLCERITHAFPIGNVHEGLNFEKIYELIYYYISRMDKCSDCKVSRICGNCYSSFARDEEFACSSEMCKIIESDMKESFIDAFIIAEMDPGFVEESNLKFRNIKKYYGD
jgi:uncharacterized protein